MQIKTDNKAIITIPYEPAYSIMDVEGKEVRKARLEAGISNVEAFMMLCNEGLDTEHQRRLTHFYSIEKPGLHQMSEMLLYRMIEVCNSEFVESEAKSRPQDADRAAISA